MSFPFKKFIRKGEKYIVVEKVVLPCPDFVCGLAAGTKSRILDIAAARSAGDIGRI